MRWPVSSGIGASVIDIVLEGVFHLGQKGKVLRFAGFFLYVVDPAVAKIHLAEGQLHNVAGSHGQLGSKEQSAKIPFPATEEVSTELSIFRISSRL